MTPAPDIAVTDSFARYLERFRARFPLDVELARKHGIPTGHGRLEKMQMTQQTLGYGGSA